MEQFGRTVFLRPSEIRFSREEIPSKFADYGDLHRVVTKLILNPKLINTIPLMTISNRNNGEWHSENNRRLYVFRVLERKAVVDTIQVKISNQAILPFVSDDGCHVRLHGKVKALPHCNCIARCSLREVCSILCIRVKRNYDANVAEYL
ncbi:uncharacterized protein LOC143448989 isoform X1 [Clavelina lepadiformis]|uniref:uncharacterized protein LOC143448989 isoform X1 n=1 Tax=Clavelina lepadiformis TaxID=159417 RepID=UPI004041FA93